MPLCVIRTSDVALVGRGAGSSPASSAIGARRTMALMVAKLESSKFKVTKFKVSEQVHFELTFYFELSTLNFHCNASGLTGFFGGFPVSTATTSSAALRCSSSSDSSE